MSQLKQLYQRKVWIGATDRDKEGKWLWVSGQVMNGHYGHWKSGQGPSQSGFLFMNGMLEDCALLDYSDAGRWHDYMCNSLFHRFGYICEYNQIEQLSVLSPQTPQNNMSKLITTTKHPIKQSVHGQHTMKITTLQTTKSSVLKTNTPRRTPSTSSMSLRTAKIVAFQTSSVKHHTMTRTNIWKVTTPGSAKTPNTTKRRNKPSFGPIVNKMTTLQIQQNSTQQQTSTREKMSTSNKVTVRTKNGADINNCPPNLQRTKYLSVYKASCLQIVPLFKTWKDARKYCQHNHGDLVTITNFDKEVFVMSQLRSQNRHQKTWIGATDQVSEGNWKWVTGETVNGHYGNWKQGQGPTRKHGFLFSGARWEDCALIDYNDFGKWNDYLCNSRFYRYQFICEYAQLTTTTSATTSTTTQTSTTIKTTTTAKPPTTTKPTTSAATTTKLTTVPTTTTNQPTSTTVRTSTTTTTQPLTTTKMTTTTRRPTTSTVKTTSTPATTSSKSPTTTSTVRTTTVTTHLVSSSSKTPAQVKKKMLSTSTSTKRTTGSPSPVLSTKRLTSGKITNTGHKNKPKVSTTMPSSPRSKLSSKSTRPATGSPLLGYSSGQHVKNKGSKGLKGYVIGILVVGVVLLGGAAMVMFFVFKRRMATKRSLTNHVDNLLYVDEHTLPTFSNQKSETSSTFSNQETENKPIQSFNYSSEA